MQHPFEIPKQKKIRLIIDTDAKNEADDQFAIVHALLSPRLITRGIIAAHFGSGRNNGSMQRSFDEVVKLQKLMKIEKEIKVLKGATDAMLSEDAPEVSEGADFIVSEANTEDPRPLFVIFLGPLTDLAAAYKKDPSIAKKMTAIWIGGGAWPKGEWEFNLAGDIPAANVVFQSQIPLWQVPRNVYGLMRVSIAELAVKVRPCGEIGAYLYQQLVDFNMALAEVKGWPKGEMWCLGDSPAVGLLLDDHDYAYDMKPAPRISKDMHYEEVSGARPIRVYHFIDSRFILEDMFAKLQLHYIKR